MPKIIKESHPSLSTLQDIVREVTAFRLQQYFDISSVELKEKKDYQLGQVLDDWMSIIFLSGESLFCMIKTHFSIPEGKKIVSNLLGMEESEVKMESVIDQLKETNNLLGGSLKKVLEENSINVGLSLPICSRGIYEVFTKYSRLDESKSFRAWDIKCGKFEIMMTSFLDAKNDELYEKVKKINLESLNSQTSEINFL